MRTVVLSGFMATGKTTIGARLASRLRLPFVDIDAAIEEAVGKSLPDLWRAEDEAAFRARELELVRPLLESRTPRVIALGGGAVTSRELRYLALDHAFVVTLTASPETILARAGTLESRPNLNTSDPKSRARSLLDGRAAVYAECHFSLSTDGVDVEDLVVRITKAMERDPIVVPLGLRSYLVDVTSDEPSRLTDALACTAPSSIFLVTDAHVQRDAPFKRRGHRTALPRTRRAERRRCRAAA